MIDECAQAGPLLYLKGSGSRAEVAGNNVQARGSSLVIKTDPGIELTDTSNIHRTDALVDVVGVVRHRQQLRACKAIDKRTYEDHTTFGSGLPRSVRRESTRERSAGATLPLL